MRALQACGVRKRTAAWLALVALVALVIVIRVQTVESSSVAAVAPPAPVVEHDAAPLDMSLYGTPQAITDLDEDNYIHHAFVAVGPDDVTIWKDRSSRIRTAAGVELCEQCLTSDFVLTHDRLVWVDHLETDMPGFDMSLRAISTTSRWTPRHDGSSLTAGDRICASNLVSAIATDGAAVYSAEGKGDHSGVGDARTVVRVDLAKGTKTVLARTGDAVRNLVFSSGELFVIWSAPVNPPVWRVQAISTKTGAIRDVVTWRFRLPELTASPSDLYFSYRDDFPRTSRGHLASVPLAGGPITNLYDTAPGEVIGHFAADDSGLYVVRFAGRWTLTRFAKGAPPQDLARFDAMPRAIATRKADIAVAFLEELKLVPK